MACGALAIAVLAIVCVEGALAMLGIGAPPPGFESGLEYQRVFLPTFEPTTRPNGEPALATVDPRLPYQWLEAEKPADTLRVFCFGGSATAGLGFSPNVTFPRYLDKMLAEAAPDKRVEVYNLGMVALPASGVRWLVRDVCANLEPDLLVVYSGNNEFLEPHSRAYFRATASFGRMLKWRLAQTHMWGLLRGKGAGDRPTITSRDIAANDKRVDHKSMLAKVQMSVAEETAVLEAYEARLEEMAAVAEEAGVPLLLCTVATNVEWWAMDDPDLKWLKVEAGGRPETALALTEDHLDAELPLEAVFASGLAGIERDTLPEPSHEAHLWAYRRAQVLDQLGESAAATRAFAEALELDPHRRRATAAHAVRVRRVAAGTGAELYDTVADLEARFQHGRVGFDAFYDYVHFTPEGAMAVAAGVLGRIEALGLLPGVELADYDAEAFIARERRRIEGLEDDSVAVSNWMGLGFDKRRLHDRDLWKYDRARDEVDRHIHDHPHDWRGWAHRGNARFFEPGGREEARHDYERALELEEVPEVRSNLEKLMSTQRP